jgi:hypothetical protein
MGNNLKDQSTNQGASKELIEYFSRPENQSRAMLIDRIKILEKDNNNLMADKFADKVGINHLESENKRLLGEIEAKCEEAFEAGRDFEYSAQFHAVPNSRPNFKEWKANNLTNKKRGDK